MTITKRKQIGFDRFCEELDLISNYFTWNINQSKFSIRCAKKKEKFCPITAVSYALYGKKYKVNQWDKAAEAIGLPFWIANNIAQAADSGLLFNAKLEDYYQKMVETLK
jgi:hypothetical protein